MRTLAFDPGEVTGVAILDSAGNWEVSMTVPLTSLTEEFMEYTLHLARAGVIVVESLPAFARNTSQDRSYQTIVNYCANKGFNVEVVNPGQWKSMGKRSKISGIHQNDAATMAIWYYNSRLSNNRRMFE